MRQSPSGAAKNSGLLLIIDDDDMIAVALHGHLAASGYAIDLAVDSAHAAELLATTRYALVVMDPYLTGHLHERAFEFVEAVRQLGHDAHVIVLTAYRSADFARRVESIDAITLVAKPQPVSYLAELIEGLLAARGGGPTNTEGALI